ncbi:hypothetical protein B4U80_12236 [Leptotrombidium deliense]|uniref:Peptidase S8/S53 domain-containing protein n=1 Tax=Leptotrombidium deliense TaxID=299467 RepID=A0A443RWF9_9ACAR|nr:hypothetical protein B4U80_12236 [Leptotrombidium deliense]
MISQAANRAIFGIEYIADNNGNYRVMEGECAEQSNSGCCLAKISDSINFKYKDQGGAGIVVYVIDSGADINHPDFGGRASRGGNHVSGEDEKDNHGHGTATMSDAIGSIAGVTKKATGVAIKVMNRQGYGNVQ